MREEKRSETTARSGMIMRVGKNRDQNIKRDEAKKVSKSWKQEKQMGLVEWQRSL